MRRTAGEELTNFGHYKRRERARRLPAAFEGGLERKAIHDGCKHSHRIASRTRDAAGRYLDAPEYISSADNDRDFSSQRPGRGQIAGDTIDGGLIDAERLRTRQIFPEASRRHDGRPADP